MKWLVFLMLVGCYVVGSLNGNAMDGSLDGADVTSSAAGDGVMGLTEMGDLA